MRLNLKLTHIGLILVGIPLVCELGFVGLLTYVNQQAEYEITRQAKAKEIAYVASGISTLVGEAAANLAGYSRTRSPFFKDRYEKAVTRWGVLLVDLENLLADDAKELATLQEAKKIEVKGRRLLDLIKDHITDGSTGRELVTNPVELIEIKRMIDGLATCLSTIVQDEHERVADGPEREAKARKLAQIVLGLGIALNILVAIFLSRFFGQNIGRRVACIIDNTTRVPKGLPLNNPLKGGDEMAQLDEFFHRMVSELEESRKMQRYLIATVSHDLRSPLTTVQGMLTLLAAGAYGELSKTANEKVERAESDITRLLALTDDLLDTERLASGKLEITFAKANVADTIHDAVESVKTFADQHKVGIDVECDKDQVAEFDRARIIQVLVNLITNAIKYSPPQSVVTITSGCDQKWLTIKVIDTGRGVPAQYQEIIFEKFQQVTESDAREKGGKGLGLAICKSIIEQHSGTVGVFSENGSGSTFWIRIPLKQVSSFRHQINVSPT